MTLQPRVRYLHDLSKNTKVIGKGSVVFLNHVLVKITALEIKFPAAAVAEWYRYLIVAGFATSSSPVLLKTRRVGQQCTLTLSRAETSSRWCGVVVSRGGTSSGVIHDT
ncbi:uncharacterized protein TNCV_494641 [Trichonephila clavipes]|nr:uncharacterized protein TNCV_494641 [Trichonephila clavipes]